MSFRKGNVDQQERFWQGIQDINRADRTMNFNIPQEIHHKQRDFVLDVSKTLQKKYKSNDLLSLIEAGVSLNGATSDLLAAIENYPPRQWSVLLHDKTMIEEVAPYLVSLQAPGWYAEDDPLTTFTDWLAEQAHFSRWGVFFVTEAGFSEVKTFWQRFSYASFNNKKTAYFRFYHPRFFHSLIKNLGRKDYAQVGAVVNMIFYFDYFQPNIVHVCRFHQSQHQIKQYDLLKEDIDSIVCATMSDFRPDEVSETV